MPTTGEPNNNYASKPFRGDEFFSNWTILLSRAELFCSIPTLPFLFDSPGKQSKQQKEFLTVKSKQEELQQYFYNIKIKTPSSDVFGNPTNWSSTLGQLPWGCQGLGERAWGGKNEKWKLKRYTNTEIKFRWEKKRGIHRSSAWWTCTLSRCLKTPRCSGLPLTCHLMIEHHPQSAIHLVMMINWLCYCDLAEPMSEQWPPLCWPVASPHPSNSWIYFLRFFSLSWMPFYFHQRCILFQQSTVPEHAELCWVLACLASVPRFLSCFFEPP